MRIHAQRRAHLVKRVLLTVAALMLGLAAAAGAWALAFITGVQNDLIDSPEHDKTVEALTRQKAEPFTVLLLGDDRRPGETRARADTIIVARIDAKSKEVRMVSIPRDSRVEIPGYGMEKINAATFHGGPALMVDTLEDYLGVPINHYMMVDFRGFQGVVDAMGGVRVDVDVEINDKKAASHGSRQAYHIPAGDQLLDGEHALTYVRSRKFPDGDFTRMRHQQTFFKALAKQSLKLGNVFKLPGVVKEMARHTTSDMSVTEILALVQALRGLGEKNVQAATLVGPSQTIGGVSYVIPDEYVKEQLSEALRSGADIEGADETPAEQVDPASVTVTVRNGAGISGCAADAADRLRGKGYTVGDVGNANRFVYETTLVIFKDREDKARSVARALGVARVVESRGMYSFSTDVLVVVGKDWRAGAGDVSGAAGTATPFRRVQ
ncbi:MAG: LCP family protein [Coriobacteriia bacterium]|nr:LCP family protein [Coriobacteriia bacterium]